MNIVTVTGRVKIAPDPFTKDLGFIYKEYYKRTQIVNIINQIANKDVNLWKSICRTKPDFSFIYYGKTSTTFDVTFQEVHYAKERIDKGYIFLEPYNDFVVEAYYCSLEKEELVSMLWENIQPLADKTPYHSTDHIVVSRINMTSENVIEYEYIQDDVKADKEELFNERLIQFFDLKTWKRGLLKALSYNDIKFRYKYINKSNKQVFSDSTFTGEELLEIYDSINKEK